MWAVGSAPAAPTPEDAISQYYKMHKSSIGYTGDLGSEAYKKKASEFSTKKNPLGYDLVSAMMSEAGIPGIRYLDQGSRGAGEGTHNYVVFDDRIPKIVEINGQPVDVSNLANKLRGK